MTFVDTVYLGRVEELLPPDGPGPQQCGPGGDANDMANQFTIFNISSTRGDLFEIRLRVDDLNLGGDIKSKIIGFAGIGGG